MNSVYAASLVMTIGTDSCVIVKKAVKTCAVAKGVKNVVAVEALTSSVDGSVEGVRRRIYWEMCLRL